MVPAYEAGTRGCGDGDDIAVYGELRRRLVSTTNWVHTAVVHGLGLQRAAVPEAAGQRYRDAARGGGRLPTGGGRGARSRCRAGPAVIHRHLDYPAATAARELPLVAVVDILDLGDLDDRRPLAAAPAGTPPRGEPVGSPPVRTTPRDPEGVRVWSRTGTLLR